MPWDPWSQPWNARPVAIVLAGGPLDGTTLDARPCRELQDTVRVPQLAPGAYALRFQRPYDEPPEPPAFGQALYTRGPFRDHATVTYRHVDSPAA